MEPPGLIKLEKEIEQEEGAGPQPPPSPVSPAQDLPPSLSASPPPSPAPAKVAPGKKSTGKLLDDAVSGAGTPPRPPSLFRVEKNAL